MGDQLKALDRAIAAHRRDEERASKSLDALHEAIRTAAEAGVKQVELVRRTGYTREHIRRICDPKTWSRSGSPRSPR